LAGRVRVLWKVVVMVETVLNELVRVADPDVYSLSAGQVFVYAVVTSVTETTLPAGTDVVDAEVGAAVDEVGDCVTGLTSEEFEALAGTVTVDWNEVVMVETVEKDVIVVEPSVVMTLLAGHVVV
jgi:hypothetical protein